MPSQIKEALLDLEEELEKAKETLIIVEGKKDKKALNELGCRNVIELEGPLFAVVEKASALAKKTIILTDLDKEGRKLFGKLSSDLQKRGVKVDNRLREALFRTEIRQIEGLKNYLDRKSHRI